MTDVVEKISHSSEDDVTSNYKNNELPKNATSTTSISSGKKSPISHTINTISNGIEVRGTMNSCKLNELDTFLNDNLQHSNQVKQPWNKLTRDDKIGMIKIYATKYVEENNIHLDENPILCEYLISAMDKKRLSKVKEIVYDKDNEIIISIPILMYTTSTNKFTLKRVDKRQSTLKSLTPKKSKSSSSMKASKPTIETRNLMTEPDQIAIDGESEESEESNEEK